MEEYSFREVEKRLLVLKNETGNGTRYPHLVSEAYAWFIYCTCSKLIKYNIPEGTFENLAWLLRQWKLLSLADRFLFAFLMFGYVSLREIDFSVGKKKRTAVVVAKHRITKCITKFALLYGNTSAIHYMDHKPSLFMVLDFA